MADTSLDQKLLAGIGGVVRDSGHALIALQQVIETVTGTGLLYFTMRDDTLGGQVKTATAIFKNVGTSEWIEHPPVDQEVRDALIRILSEMGYLVSLRNRIVHDIWMASATSEEPEGIHSFSASRWGKYSIQSNVRALREIAVTFFSTAVALQEADRAIYSLRQLGERSPLLGRGRDDALCKMREKHAELSTKIEGMRTGKLEGWRWLVQTPSSMPDSPP